MSIDALYDLIEMEALEKYYLWKENEQRYAEKPAVTINSGFTADPNGKNRYTLYFGRGIAHFNFSSINKAHVKVGEMFKGKKAIVVDHKGKTRICRWKSATSNSKSMESKKSHE